MLKALSVCLKPISPYTLYLLLCFRFARLKKCNLLFADIKTLLIFVSKKQDEIFRLTLIFFVMSTSYFSFSTDERVVWMTPKTRSIYAIYKGSELKADGNEYAVIQPLPGIHDEKWSGESMTVLAEQLVPVYE